MLDFMKEHGAGSGDKSDKEKPSSPADSSVKEGPGVDVRSEAAEQQEYLSVRGRDRQARKTTILLGVLFFIGLLGLVFMIKSSSPSTTQASACDAEDTQIEIAIAQLTGVKSEMFNQVDQVAKKLDEFSSVRQIKVDELAKNPFKHDAFLGDLEDMASIGENDADAEAVRRQLLKQQTKNMQLLSIMQSGQPDANRCCMIDDKILYEGDSIKGFKVFQISDSFVKLESEGIEVLLQLTK